MTNAPTRTCITALAGMLLLVPPTLAHPQSLQRVADSSPFRPLDLPTPNEIRTASGRPGAKYWQQRVDYKIAATLDSARNEIRGRETIHYVNHSPDSLPYLWLFVEQNLCAPNSVTNQLNQPPLVFLGTAFDFSCQPAAALKNQRNAPPKDPRAPGSAQARFLYSHAVVTAVVMRAGVTQTFCR